MKLNIKANITQKFKLHRQVLIVSQVVGRKKKQQTNNQTTVFLAATVVQA